MSIRTTNEEIIQAYMETGSVWKAAKNLGLCGQSVWERLRRLNVVMSHTEWTPEELHQVQILAEQGMPISRIANSLGRTYAAIACKLSRMEIKHPYRPPQKPKRGKGLTKAAMVRIWMRIDRHGDSIAQAARWSGVTTSGLVNALQAHTPDEWRSYVLKHSELPESECPGCGQPFIKLTKKQRYCSGKCGMNARQDVRYFGGNRKNTVGLAEGICQLCTKSIKKGLSSHHIYGKEHDEVNECLVALCPGCHQAVTVLSRNGSSESSEFWENLIGLCCMRNQGKRKPLGFHVMVDIDELTDADLGEVGEPARANIRLEEV